MAILSYLFSVSSSSQFIFTFGFPENKTFYAHKLCLMLFGAGLSKLTTDERLQGAFAPFGRILEGTNLLQVLSNIQVSVHPFPRS